MKKRLYLLAQMLLVTVTMSAQQTEYVSPAGTKFLLYTPPSYFTTTSTYPLLISLHGKGEWGTDITELTSGNSTGMPSRLIYLNQWPPEYNFIVLTPQYNPPNASDPYAIWPAAHIDEVVNYVISNWRIKTSRIYVTGLSFGANATWNYAAAYPNKVAAIIPISGRADLAKACLVKNIPAWVFHGDDDATANMAYSVDMVNAINGCQPSGIFNRKFNALYSKGHEGWNEVYNKSNGYKVFDWMMKFSKGSTSNPTPYVNAGPDLSLNVGAGSVNIIGDAFDSRGNLVDLKWMQLSGIPLTLSNSTGEVLRITNLQTGTFEFQLVATDNHGAKTADRMILRVYGATTLPAVTNLFLTNGETGEVILPLSEGMVIDKSILNISQINIRADASVNTRSVRFSINTNRNTRTVNTPGPYFIKTPSTTKPEWQIEPGEYIICATPYSGTSASGSRGISKSFKITVIEGVPMAGCEGAGKIFREVWSGIPGIYVTDIPLTTPPQVVGELFSFESPTGEVGMGDNYGARIRGYICPVVTGDYTFWIASDDRSELWLSSSANPVDKIMIAAVNGSTLTREWTKYPSQKSVLIPLQSGTKYYIEALHKESTRGDHLAVGWQLPDGTLQRPIPGIRLIPFDATSAPGEPLVDVISPEGSVTVYPNPFLQSENTIHLRGLKGQQRKRIEIQVLSVTGQRITQVQSDCDESCHDIPINFERRLSPGVYVIHANTAEGRVIKKFVAY